MPDFDITLLVNVIGMGNVAPQQKFVTRTVTATSLAAAVAQAQLGFLKIRVVKAVLSNPADASFVDAVDVVP